MNPSPIPDYIKDKIRQQANTKSGKFSKSKFEWFHSDSSKSQWQYSEIGIPDSWILS